MNLLLNATKYVTKLSLFFKLSFEDTKLKTKHNLNPV